MDVIDEILSQHAEEASNLWSLHQHAVRAGRCALKDLRRLDDRIEAHVDGLRIAGEAGWKMCQRQLTDDDSGGAFTATVLALEARDPERISALLAVGEASASLCTGIVSAFGWVPRDVLQGTVKGLLESASMFRRCIGLASCAAHRVDPGPYLDAALRDGGTSRMAALRAAGELGRVELVPGTPKAESDQQCHAWGTWSSVLLGNRGAAIEVLKQTGMVSGPHRARAFRLALQAMDLTMAHSVLQDVATDPQHGRWLIEGSGIAGDPAYVPWLIDNMRVTETARLAGEAFTLITGVDLVHHSLEGEPPLSFDSGPNGDPEDPNVDMDPDSGLPWPDPEKVQQWWTSSADRFHLGTRHFMGAPVTRAHCLDVLKNGYQRQRILAAHYLCLLEPGTPLFNTSAPAWRQQRLLAKMT
ncbi:MAG: TIGR02270 family protein [Acidobacteriota bacterium]